MSYRKRKSANSEWEWKKRKLATAEGIAQYVNAQHNPQNMRGTAESRRVYGDTWRLANADQRLTRMQAGFYGRGDYKSAMRQFGAQALRAGGRWAGAYLGGAPGGNLGYAAGAATSRWLGWGKYRRKSYRKNYKGRGDYGGDAGGNQIMAGSTETPLTVNQTEDLSGDIILSHREFLGNVTAIGTGLSTPSAFTIASYPLNVGLQPSFPWLSQLAQNFTLYEPEGMIFEYVPNSGELGSTSNALGKVVMATQYDPDAPNFTSAIQMENYDYANACKPSEHMIHGVETDPNKRATKELYVRTGPSAKSKVFTDIGTFQIATEGLPVNVLAGTVINIGELWVAYKVRLSRAQLFGTIQGLDEQMDVLIGSNAVAGLMNGGTATWFSSPGSALVPYYTTQTNINRAWPLAKNTIGVTCTGTLNNANTFAFPLGLTSGLFRCSIYVTQTNATPILGGNTWAFGSFVGCALNTDPADWSNAMVSSQPGGQTSNTATIDVYITINTSPTVAASFSAQMTTSLAGISTVNLYQICQMPRDMFK
nr:MAG: putative capsid protein [Arizlama virus]